MEFALTRKQLHKKREAQAAAASGSAGPGAGPAGPLWSDEVPVPSPLASATARAWSTRGQDGDGGSFFSAGTAFSTGTAESAYTTGTDTRLPPPIPAPPPPVRTVGLGQLLDDLQDRAALRGGDGRTAAAGEAYGTAALPGRGASTLAPPGPAAAGPDPAAAFADSTSGPGTGWADPIGVPGVGSQATSTSRSGRHHRVHGRPEAAGSRVDVLVRRYIGVVLFVAAVVLLIVFMPSERHAAPSPSGMGPISSRSTPRPAERAVASARGSLGVPTSGVTWVVPGPRPTWTSTTAGSSADA
ncbi:MAG: hypothetical protein M0Z93_01225 [Actinomycetota bacterium]|nr:hypothetical protein [Actinomycetota bacterium]